VEQQTLREKLSRLLWLYVKITAGAIAAFLFFWALSISMQIELWQNGVKLKKWQIYLGTVEWYTLMAYLVAAASIFTKEDSPEIKDSKAINIRSRRFNRCLLIALPFLGLGSLIGKSADIIDQFIGTISLIATVTIIGIFLLRDIIKWKTAVKRKG
jgi:hypothetical protein